MVRAWVKGWAVVGEGRRFAAVYPSTNTSVPQRTQDLTKARQLLAQAGVPRGFSTPLLTETTQEIPHFAQIVKQYAAQIGVTINLTIETPTKYYGSSGFGKSDWLDGEMSLVDYAAPPGPNLYLNPPPQPPHTNPAPAPCNPPPSRPPPPPSLSH